MALSRPNPGFTKPRRAPCVGRRALLLAVGLGLGLLAAPAVAEDITVPVSLQAELFVKVAGYDRNLAARAGDRVRWLVVSKANDADSRRVAAQMLSALAPVSEIGGLPKEVSTLGYTSAAELATVCRAQRIAIVYFAPGLGDEIPTIAAALQELSVLTVAAVPANVPLGLVLGVDVIEGRPKLLLNLGQARKQQVKLRPDVMQMMKVFP